jgi:hypothetical protein
MSPTPSLVRVCNEGAGAEEIVSSVHLFGDAGPTCDPAGKVGSNANAALSGDEHLVRAGQIVPHPGGRFADSQGPKESFPRESVTSQTRGLSGDGGSNSRRERGIRAVSAKSQVVRNARTDVHS